MADADSDLNININKDVVKTMERDLKMALHASKGLTNVEVQTQEDARLSELIKIIEQQRASNNIVSQQESFAKEKPASSVPKKNAAISIPTPLPKAPRAEVFPAAVLKESAQFFDQKPGIMKNSQEEYDQINRIKEDQVIEKALLKDILKHQQEEEQRRLRAEQERKRQQEEQKRIQALARIEQERRQREERRRREAEKQHQKQIEEEQRKLQIRQQAEQERRQREEEKRRQLEAAKQAREAQEQKNYTEEHNRLKQEQIINEMEQFGQREQSLSAVLKELKKRIRLHKTDLAKTIEEITAQETPLKESKAELEDKVNLILNGEYKEAVAAEAAVEAKEEELLKSGKHKQLTLEQEKILSQRLWDIEDQRKQKEKNRWNIEDRIKKIKNDIQDYDFKITELARRKNKALETIKTLTNAEKIIDFTEWKKNIEEEILLAETEKESLEPELTRINNEKITNEAALEQLEERLNSIQQNLNTIEIKEKEVQDPEEKRLIEQTRWEIENQLRAATQEKWELQKQLEDIAALEKEQKAKINKISAQISALEDKISAQEAVLAKAGIPTQKLRDQISLLLVENGLEVNPELLLNITQIDTETNQNEAKILDEFQGITKNPLPEKNNETEQKLETAATMPAKTQDEPLKPQESSFQKQNQTVAEITETAENIETAETINAAQNSSANQTSSIAETKINSKSKQPAENIASIESEQNIKQKSELESAPMKTAEIESTKTRNDIFREPIDDKSSLHNIPVFPENQPLTENNTSPAETEPVSPSIPVAEGNPENNISPDILESPPAIDNIIEDRWSQIASANNALTASEVAQTLVEPAKPARIPQRSKNNRRFIIMILVILLFIILIGGAAAIIILTKQNQSAPITTPPVVQKPITSKTNTANNVGSTANTNNINNTDNSNSSSNNSQIAQIPGAPVALISTISNITIITDNVNSVPSLLAPYLMTSRATDGYYRLLIQNKQTGAYIGLRQLFDVFKVKAPASLINDLNDDATFFIYSNRGQNRFGFIAKTSNAANVLQAMKNWETTIDQDADGLFKFLGKKQAPKQPGVFQSRAADNIAYRYIYFQPESENLGIFYAVYQNYFIFTSSAQSLTQIFDQLPK